MGETIEEDVCGANWKKGKPIALWNGLSTQQRTGMSQIENATVIYNPTVAKSYCQEFLAFMVSASP